MNIIINEHICIPLSRETKGLRTVRKCIFVFWIFLLFEPYVHFHSFSSVRVTEWPLIGE